MVVSRFRPPVSLRFAGWCGALALSLLACSSESAPPPDDEPAESNGVLHAEASPASQTELGVSGWAVRVTADETTYLGYDEAQQVAVSLGYRREETATEIHDLYLLSRDNQSASISFVHQKPAAGEAVTEEMLKNGTMGDNTLQTSDEATRAKLTRALELLKDDVARKNAELSAAFASKVSTSSLHVSTLGIRTTDLVNQSCTDLIRNDAVDDLKAKCDAQLAEAKANLPWSCRNCGGLLKYLWCWGCPEDVWDDNVAKNEWEDCTRKVAQCQTQQGH